MSQRKYFDAHLRENFAGKRILVTGGFGFIGSQVAHRLLQCGAHVSVLDIDTSEQRLSLVNDHRLGLRDSFEILLGSVADFEFMKAVFTARRYDYVFNLAAYASTVEKAVEEPLETFTSNSLGVVCLLEAIRATSTTLEMFFHASTDKVYGELAGEAYLETDSLDAEGLYDTAKMAADAFARSYDAVFKIPTVVLRMCNIFGPYDLNIQSRLLPKSLHSIFGASEAAAPTLYTGSLSHSRDYLYIDDLVYSILLLSADSTCHGQAFNALSCGHKTTPDMLREVVAAACHVASRIDPALAAEIEANGIREQRADKSDLVLTITRQHLNSDKLQATIGFTPMVSLEEGLRLTAAFYQEYFATASRQAEAAEAMA